MELKCYVSDELVNYKEDRWKDEYYEWMYNFLTQPSEKALYFWCDFKDIEVANLHVSNTAPPKFYNEDIKAENYNVVCFIKKDDTENITLDGL
jgi:hypothetical protein